MISKEKQFNYIILFICFISFLIYSYTSFKIHLPNYLELKHLIFNWPDANANYFFAQINSLSFFEPLNSVTNNLIHTRSMNVFDFNLVPVTFLPGVLIFGLFFKILGPIGILFLIPLLASLTGYIIYRLSYLIFKDLSLSLFISVFFLFLSPWIFFANMVMLPIVLLIFLLLLGFLLYRKNYILGSSLISLAIIVRPTEIVWIISLIILILIYNRKKFDIKKGIISLIILFIFFYLFLYLNKITYGNYFSLGYFNLQNNTLPTEFLDSNNNILNYLKMIFIPFGFNFILILKNFYIYYIQFIWGHVILAFFSLIPLLLKLKVNKEFKEKRIWKYYLLSLLIVFPIILIYYGSWDIADPLVKELNTISSSYTRYFMPLFILILPLATLLLNIFVIRLKGINKIYHILLLSLVFAIPLSIKAFTMPNDGLLQNKENLIEYYNQFKQIKKIVPKDSVIISERSDKIFFPYYKTITLEETKDFWNRVDNINDREIYYYTDKEVDDEYIQINNFKLIKIK